MLADETFHPVKGNAIEVVRMIDLQVTQFKTHYCGVIAGDVFYIAAAFFILPANAVCRIILVTKHDAFAYQFF